MPYRVDLTDRARDLTSIHDTIGAAISARAEAWFDRLRASIGRLDQHPAINPITPETSAFRHLLYGRKPHIYRVIYAIDEVKNVVTVVHVRHGARQAFGPEIEA